MARMSSFNSCSLSLIVWEFRGLKAVVLLCAVRGYSCFVEGELDDVRSQIFPPNKVRHSGYSCFQNGNL